MNSLIRAFTAAGLAVCFLICAGCATSGAVPGSRSAEEAQQDIQDMHSALLKAYNGKNASGIAALYTDDAVLMPPNLATVKSKIAVEDFMRQMLVPPMSGMLLNYTETNVCGDNAYSYGYYTELGANGVTIDRGKFVEILRNDGGWKISRDIWNSDMIAPTASTAPAAGTTSAPAAATH